MPDEKSKAIPILDCLIEATSSEWSGQVAVRSSSNQYLGVVVLRHGQIAWAVSQSQPETLGHFLERLGRVTKAQLAPIRRRFDEEGGRRKLGELLEEAGLIRRPVLRRCLLLHTRRAIDSLLGFDDAVGTLQPGLVRVDEDLTFSWQEIISGTKPRVTRDPLPSSSGGEKLLVQYLSKIPGYKASAILSADGEAIAFHCHEEGFDFPLLGAYLSSLIEASSDIALYAQLGGVRFLLLDCLSGSLVARWIDDHRTFLAAAVVGEKSPLGNIKYELTSAIPAMSRFLEKS